MQIDNINIGLNGKSVRRIGFHFGLGLLEAFGAVWLLGSLLSFALSPTDDCDTSRFERCGLKVATDAKTGKEYLVASGGGIVERAKP